MGWGDIRPSSSGTLWQKPMSCPWARQSQAPGLPCLALQHPGLVSSPIWGSAGGRTGLKVTQAERGTPRTPSCPLHSSGTLSRTPPQPTGLLAAAQVEAVSSCGCPPARPSHQPSPPELWLRWTEPSLSVSALVAPGTSTGREHSFPKHLQVCKCLPQACDMTLEGGVHPCLALPAAVLGHPGGVLLALGGVGPGSAQRPAAHRTATPLPNPCPKCQ